MAMAYAVVMRLADMVLKMTPFGVAAIMASMVIKTDYAAILSLGTFVGASSAALAGVLISVEPLIDMGRSVINVSDALVAGAVTGRINGDLDLTEYNAADAELDQIRAVLLRSFGGALGPGRSR